MTCIVLNVIYKNSITGIANGILRDHRISHFGECLWKFLRMTTNIPVDIGKQICRQNCLGVSSKNMRYVVKNLGDCRQMFPWGFLNVLGNFHKNRKESTNTIQRMPCKILLLSEKRHLTNVTIFSISYEVAGQFLPVWPQHQTRLIDYPFRNK